MKLCDCRLDKRTEVGIETTIPASGRELLTALDNGYLECVCGAIYAPKENNKYLLVGFTRFRGILARRHSQSPKELEFEDD